MGSVTLMGAAPVLRHAVQLLAPFIERFHIILRHCGWPLGVYILQIAFASHAKGTTPPAFRSLPSRASAHPFADRTEQGDAAKRKRTANTTEEGIRNQAR